MKTIKIKWWNRKEREEEVPVPAPTPEPAPKISLQVKECPNVGSLVVVKVDGTPAGCSGWQDGVVVETAIGENCSSVHHPNWYIKVKFTNKAGEVTYQWVYPPSVKAINRNHNDEGWKTLEEEEIK